MRMPAYNNKSAIRLSDFYGNRSSRVQWWQDTTAQTTTIKLGVCDKVLVRATIDERYESACGLD